MSEPKRVQAGVPTGGQFAASERPESGVSLADANPVESFLADKARSDHQRFLADVHHYAATYRTTTNPREADYTGSANLLRTASLVAETTGDEQTQIAIEDAGWALDEEPADQVARDACAAVIKNYAAYLSPEDHFVHAHRLPKGAVVLVDGEERTVDSLSTVTGGHLFVDFESYDREPDGSPTAYLSRELNALDAFQVVSLP